MGIVQSISVLALRQVTIGACRTLGVIGVDAAMSFLGDRFSDNSRRLSQALQGSTAKAWQSLEIALAGESLWNKLDDADDRAFRLQLRAFLDHAPLEDLPARDADFRALCLRELRGARKSGLLLGGAVDSADLAQQAANLAPFTGSAGLVEREWQALDNTAALLREGGHSNLARLVALRPGGEQLPLIAVAVRYFFRRAVEQDAELHRGLSFAQWDALAEGQQRGFEQLNEALESQGRRLDTLLDLLGEVREAVLDLRQEIAGQRDQIKQLAHDVMGVLGQHQLEKRELRGGDSLSIRNDDERRMVKELVARYRALPTEQRRGLPALLNAVGKMEVVAGNFDAARRDFEELVQIVPSERGRAEAFFNAYQAALECRRWDDALAAYRQASGFDAERFSLFPPSKYEPERILGAGGFGVAFLCKDRHTGSRIVVKPIRADGLDRSVTEVFAEARALEELSDDSIIRLRHCDYAGAGNTRPYLVMDYFESVTLADHVAQHGPLTQGDAVVLLSRVARALQKAHDRGICHRDVKPANILVAGGGVKLIDFGLALRQQMVTTTLGAASSYTQTLMGSSIAGTIDYAAPEQLGKRPGDKVGPHSDVYGLGKTACFALFGTTLPLARHWRAVPADLADLLGQCLADDPRERPASCREVADRLTGAAAVPVAVAVPVAPVRTAVAAEDTVAKPPDPLPLLIVGGVFGAFTGLIAGIQLLWYPDPTVVGLLLMLFLSVASGLAATAGRRRKSFTIPGLAPAGLALCLPLIFVLHVLLAPYSMQDELHHLSAGTMLSVFCILVLVWVMGYGWGAVFDQTAAVMLAVGLIAFFGIQSQSAAFAFAGALIAGIAAFVFEVAHPFRMLDQTLDKAFLGLLEPLGRVLSGSRRTARPERPAPAAAAPVLPVEQLPPVAPSPVSLAFRLPLLVIACGFAGLGVGTNSGAAWTDVEYMDRDTMMVILMTACGIAGTCVILFSRSQGFLLNSLWFLGGAAVSFGLAGLVGGFGWYWVDTPAAIVVGVCLWITAIGTMSGARRGHPALGFAGGVCAALFVAGSGWYLGHADPAGLLGIAAGVFAATLLWSGLSSGWLLAARGIALAVLAAAASLIFVFQPELGWAARPFQTASGNPSGYKDGGYGEKREDRTGFTASSPALHFSSDGTRLLSLQNSTVHLWDVALGRPRDTYDYQPKRGGSSQSIPLVAVGFFGDDPRRLSLESREEQGKPSASSLVMHSLTTGSPLSSFDFKAGDSPILAGGWGGDDLLAVAGNGEEQTIVRFPPTVASSLTVKVRGTVTAASIQGDRVLLGFQDGAIRLVVLSGQQSQVLHETMRFASTVKRLGFSRSGRFAYALSGAARSHEGPNSSRDGGTLVAWNVEQWKDFFTVATAVPASSLPRAAAAQMYGYEKGSGPVAAATCAAFSPDNRLLLAGTDRGTVQVWNMQSQERLRTYKLTSSFIISRTRRLRAVAVSPDGTQLAAMTDGGRILLMRLRELDGR